MAALLQFKSSLEMEKGKRIETANGEIALPDAIIQHIQSFLSREEAARTTILSKSWYNAWLTRPSIDLDVHYFNNRPSIWDAFEESAKKTMQRYQDSGLKIESFRLRSGNNDRWADELIVNAMKIGATEFDIQLSSYTLPRELVGSKTLVRLSVCESSLKEKYVSCSRLKSLSLKFVDLTNDNELKHIISCCNLLEELSLSYCFRFTISPKNLYELHKLRRLFLHYVTVDTMFFTDFESRFPCLKDLSILYCLGCTRVQIASTSLEAISFEIEDSWTATFDVPNIRKFTYSGPVLPRFSINGASREWEFDISIACNRFNKLSWFLSLKKLLTKFRLSRIYLSIDLQYGRRISSEHEVDIEVVEEPLVVENLTINAPSSFCCALLVRLFGICRPKFITLYWLTDKCNASLDILCKKLMNQQPITANCGIPDQDMFGPFDLKNVNVQVYEMIYTKWRPLLLKEPLDVSKISINKRKIRFELKWED